MVEIVVETTTNTTPDIVLNVHARILQQRLDVNLSKAGLTKGTRKFKNFVQQHDFYCFY